MAEILTIAQTLAYTDSLGAEKVSAGTLLAAIAADAQAMVTFVYGDGTTANLSLGSPAAIRGLGAAADAALSLAQGSGFYGTLMAGQVSALSSLLSQYGGAASGWPTSVKDLTSLLRYKNGCSDPSPAGAGAGSDYTYLLTPDFAALQSLLTNAGSVFPPDTVFAPSSLSLGSYDAAAATFTAGLAMMQATTAPYAPAKGWVAKAGATPPNGTLFVTLTGMNQAGASVTWRGDATIGFAGANTLGAANSLKGTDGGANGGTAAPTDRLTSITTIARDTTVSGGGTATAGSFSVVTQAER